MLHSATQALISIGVENVDQFLVKVDTLREEGKRANPEEFWKLGQQRLVHKKARTCRGTRQLFVKPQSEAAVADQLVKGCEKEGTYDDDRYTEGTGAP